VSLTLAESKEMTLLEHRGLDRGVASGKYFRSD
jgi:hypothetical protein